MPCIICTFLTAFRVLVTAPTNTLYMLLPGWQPKRPATEADDEVGEADVIEAVDEADEAEVADENSVIAPGCLRSVVRWFLLEPVMSV